MIEAEVVFDGDDIRVNSKTVFKRNDIWVVIEDQRYEDYFDTLEQAIQYCMEN